MIKVKSIVSSVLIVTSLLVVGCSSPSDPNQKLVLDYLKKQHGRDPVTVVKTYGTATSDAKLGELLDTIIGTQQKTAELAKAHAQSLRNDINDADASEANELLRRYDAKLGESLALNRELDELKALRDRLPFAATKLVYRVPDERGENSLNSKLFILRDGQVDQVVDLTSDHPFIGFSERAFPD